MQVARYDKRTAIYKLQDPLCSNLLYHYHSKDARAKSHNLSTRCAFATTLLQACQQNVAMSTRMHVVTHNSLTSCGNIMQADHKQLV